MENLTTNSKPKNDAILFNLENDSIENFDFKPLSKGLGFHHEKKESTKNLKRNPEPIKAKPTFKLSTTNVSNKEQALKHSSALDTFYGKSQKQASLNLEKNLKPTVKAKKKSVISKQAAFFDVLSAWFIDFIVFSGTQVLMLLAMVTFLNVGPEELVVKEYAPYLAFISFLNYLLFFSILNCSSGFGASLMKIRLVTIDNKRVSFTNTFARTFLVALSFVALGVPLIFDFHGKLSDTKWISRNV